MPDTLPRLNLDDARAVLGKMTRGPWALEQAPFVAAGETFERTEANAEGIVYCVNNFGVLVEEVAQLRAAAKSVLDNFTAEHMDVVSGTDCGSQLRTALSPAPIAQQSPKTKD